jgi:hypothetical protein
LRQALGPQSLWILAFFKSVRHWVHNPLWILAFFKSVRHWVHNPCESWPFSKASISHSHSLPALHSLGPVIYITGIQHFLFVYPQM